MLITNSLFVDCYFFASFCLGPSICTFPQSPLHTLLSEGRLLSWYINLDVDTLAYYYAGPISIPSCILRVIPVQDNSSALYKSRELSRNKDSFCSTLRWDAWPALFIIHGLHAPDTRSLSWFYSGVALGEEVCFGTQKFWGASCARSTNMVTPATQILYLVSIGRRHVPSIFWWGDHGSYQYLVRRKVLPITRAWYFVLRDTTEPACHSKNPWPHIMLSRPHACLSSKACYCIFLSSIAQEHLPWPIFHVTWFPSILWAHH